MANKLTKDKLDLLIEQVLQEKINVRVKHSYSGGADGNKISNNLGVPDGTATKAQYQNLAALDDTPSNILDDEDFKIAFASSDADVKNLATNIFNNSTKQDDFESKPKTTDDEEEEEGLPSSDWPHKGFPDPNDVELTAAGTPNKSTMAAIIKGAAKLNPSSEVIKAYADFIQKAYGGETGTSVANAMVILRKLSDEDPTEEDEAKIKNLITVALNSGITINDRNVEAIFGKMNLSIGKTALKTTKDKVLSKSITKNTLKGQVRLDSSIIKQFEVLQGTPQEKFKELADLAEMIQSGDFSDVGSDRKDVFAFATKVSVLNLFANLSKGVEAQTGGYNFEKFVVAILGTAANLGGLNGAIDVMYSTAKAMIPTSQKFISSEVFRQKMTGPAGVTASLDAYNEIIYIIGRKLGETKGRYKAVGITFVKVKKSNDNIPKYQLMGNDFSYGSEQPATVTSDGDMNIEIPNGSETMVIPILNIDSSSQTAVAAYIHRQLEEDDGFSTGILNALRNIHARINNLDKNTQEYRAETAKAEDATEYVNQIATDYTALKDDYGKIFTGDEKKGTVFTENKKNKTKSIKDLDKLIERVILNKMNKL